MCGNVLAQEFRSQGVQGVIFFMSRVLEDRKDRHKPREGDAIPGEEETCHGVGLQVPGVG